MSKQKGINVRRKKRYVLPIAVTAGVIVFLATVLFIYMSTRESPIAKMTDLLNDVMGSAMQVENKSNSDEEEITTADKIYKDMTFEVIDVQKATCTVVVTAPDMNSLFFDVFNAEDYRAAESMDEYRSAVNSIVERIDTKLSEGNYDHISATVILPLDEDGTPVLTYEFIDAVYGGLITLEQTLFDNYVAEGLNY